MKSFILSVIEFIKAHVVISVVTAVAVVAVGVGAGVGLYHHHHRPPVQPTEPTSQVEPTGTEDPTLGTEHQPTEDVTEPTGTEPTEPDSTEPSGTEPTEPGASEPTGGKEEPTEPVGTEPSEPMETEPTGPDATEPMGTEPNEPKETEPEETEPEPTEHVHSYDHVKDELKPRCDNEGYTIYSCDCGRTKAIGYEALGHDWSEWVITVEPTVESAGERQRTCSRCGTVTESVPKLDPETGEVYESYIDPMVNVKKYRTSTRYFADGFAVSDFRTWGDPPSIWINEDGTWTVVYFDKAGVRIEFIMNLPPDGYISDCSILEDGSYMVSLTGSYGG